MKYRKKPVVIEAFQTDKEMIIHTLEGDMKASVGDFIITGVNGEQYPCKPDIFEKTYELVECEDKEMDETYYEYYEPRTVRELRELLYKFPDNMKVYIDGRLPLSVEYQVESTFTGQVELVDRFLLFS